MYSVSASTSHHPDFLSPVINRSAKNDLLACTQPQVDILVKIKPLHTVGKDLSKRKIKLKAKSLHATKITLRHGDEVPGDFPYCRVGNQVTLMIKCQTKIATDCDPWAPFLTQVQHITTLVHKYDNANEGRKKIWELLGANQNLKTLENIEAPSALGFYESSLNSIFQRNAQSLKNVNFYFSLVDVSLLLAGNTHLPKLESINLKLACINDFGMQFLGELVKNAPVLHSFKCSNWNYNGNYFYGTQTFQSLLTSLETCSTLKNLSLGLENQACTQLLFQDAIFNILRLPQLSKFSLRCAPDLVPTESLTQAGKLIGSLSLEKCKFYGFTEETQFNAFIDGLTGTTTLKGLNLNYYGLLPDTGAIHLANFIGNNDGLLWFSFGFSMTALGENALAKALKSNQSVRHLKINYDGDLSAAGANAFLKALKNRHTPLDTLVIGIGSSATGVATSAILEPLIARGTWILCK